MHRQNTIYCVLQQQLTQNVPKWQKCRYYADLGNVLIENKIFRKQEEHKMKIIKRNGSEETFDRLKIKKAIASANSATSGRPELTDRQIDYIALVI